MNLQYTKKTVKYLTFKEILKDKKCTYTNLQKHVLKVSKKDPVKNYTRGYYSTNICNWKRSKLIIKKGKFYGLTSLGKLYLKDPQKANNKIKINSLTVSRDWWRNKANELYYNKLSKKDLQELKELRDENYDLSYKLNKVKIAFDMLSNL